MNALIIDDERLARNELRRLLRAHPDVDVVGEAAEADAAEAAVARLRPDLLFLDVQMPGRSGFDLLEALDPVPAVIFTTAYDRYALRAFEVSALDYLLKPVEPERLATALEKVRTRLPVPGTAPADHLTAADRVFVKEGDHCWFVRLGDVRLFESEGNYTRLYFGNERPLIHRSLNALEARLDPKTFFRASRRHILNLTHVVTLTPWFNGGLLVRLDDGHEVEMSRRRARTFREIMEL
ncbi:LytTR family DNA-binding domain-containing protein [Rhodocaloribacter litoris]|uniref:LytR/AlgR family response regulator transcription factor n=1 Tax=Rhodocaloribacter litoris TaxID=2558931 RepID=UPI00141E066E|nr:LytTR family DNA-binding domain-containing protein [Rhodocaloribacter litoris]QXD16902.1 LytTR family DNA-binding domain-containing protein [Rhodocaloribacter litoris]